MTKRKLRETKVSKQELERLRRRVKSFSPRQKRVLRALADGLHPVAAAREAGVAYSTIKGYMRNQAFRECSDLVVNNPELARLADLPDDFEEIIDLLTRSAQVKFSDYFDEGKMVPKPPSEWSEEADFALANGGSYTFSLTETENPQTGETTRTLSGSIKMPQRKDVVDRIFDMRGFDSRLRHMEAKQLAEALPDKKISELPPPGKGQRRIG